jgi:hypothetical protein
MYRTNFHVAAAGFGYQDKGGHGIVMIEQKMCLHSTLRLTELLWA